MPSRWLILFLVFLPLTFAQTPANKFTPPNRNRSKLPPDAPVITMEGVCAEGLETKDPAGEEKTCQHVVTREQFEKLSESLMPISSAASRRKFAEDYPENLLFAKKARELGLDKNPDFQRSMQFTILRAMSVAFVQNAREEAKKISDADLEQTYKEHPELFLKIDLFRIYIPKEKEPASANADPAAVAAEMKAVAEKIRAKAAAGGDFEKLQEEAYKAAGMDDPPEVHVGDQTRGTMSLDYQQAAFELEPGQISQVVPSPIGFHVFKIASKKVAPLSEARPILENLRFRETIQAAKKELKFTLDEEYFKVPTIMPPAPAENKAEDKEDKKEDKK